MRKSTQSLKINTYYSYSTYVPIWISLYKIFNGYFTVSYQIHTYVTYTPTYIIYTYVYYTLKMGITFWPRFADLNLLSKCVIISPKLQYKNK